MPTPMQAAIMSSGAYAAYVDMWFAANTYRVAGVTTGDLPLVSGFTFTGASLRTMFDSTGAMTYGPNNLALRSAEFDNASWSKLNASVTANAAVAPDGTTTADKLIPDAVSAQHGVYQGLSPLAGVRCVTSVYAKAGEYSWLFMTEGNNVTAQASFNLATGALGTVDGTGSPTGTIESVGNGWYRCTLSFVPVANIANIQCRANTANGGGNFSGDGTSGIYIWGAQFECTTYRTTPAAYMPTTSAAYYGPRLVYDPVTLASLGILVEEARTNLCLQSQDFNTTWSKANVTITSGFTSPDGTANARKIEVTTTAATILQQGAVVAATSATGSIYVKQGSGANEANRIALYNATTAATLLDGTINYSTGAWTYLTGSSGATVTSVGNGWYRVALAASSGITSGDTIRLYVFFHGASATAGVYGYAWQGQIEAGTGASSAIVTTSAAVTRAADDASLAVSPNFDAGTFMVEAQVLVLVAATVPLAAISGSSASFADEYMLYAFDTQAAFSVRQGGSAQANVTINNAVAVNTTCKLAGSYAVNNIQAAANGVAGTPDTSAALPTVTYLAIGRRAGPTFAGFRTISRIRIYNRALSDAQLQALTA